jgi:hypothetical protein
LNKEKNQPPYVSDDFQIGPNGAYEYKAHQELLDEVYRKYADSHWTPPSNPKGKLLSDQLFSLVPMEHSKESFINKCKTDSEFSERWGLRIEERELSLRERVDIFNLKMIKEGIRTQIATVGVDENYWKESLEQTKHDIPAKLITITYNDKTIESYEHIG